MRPSSGDGFPVLPLAVGGILALCAALAIIWVVTHPANVVAGVECNPSEQLAVHYHAELAISYHGTPVPIPAQVGFGTNCLYWLHTHDTSGIIHIEAPKATASRVFTLGDFFDVWGQPLDSSHVATLTVASGDRLQIWTQKQGDKAPSIWKGDPRGVPLISHETITVEIGPPLTTPKPFTFPSGT